MASKATMSQTDGTITMAEIARRCRLSKATVSRALSLPPDQCPVKPDTRDRIIRLAQGMGYRPNWRARAFSKQKTRTVGLILSGLLPQHEAIPHQILEAFTRVLRQSGYHLSLVPIDGALDWRDLVFGGHVDACATINDPDPDVVEEIRRSNLPAVLMNTRPDTPLPVVTVDDAHGARQVGRYLHDLGHRRVALYVNEEAIPHYSQQERLRGLTEGLRPTTPAPPFSGLACEARPLPRLAAARRAGLPATSSRGVAEEIHIDFIHDSHDRAMSRILDHGPLPTAIVCYSHYEAMPVLRELHERNIPVPQRISVVAFNDVFPMDCTIPAMTTVSIPADKLGTHAARLLLQQLQTGTQAKPSCKVFPESLVIRQSCAPAAPV